MDIETRVKTIISEIFDLGLDEVNENLNQESTSNWDSLGVITLATALEDEFKLRISENELMELTSYSAIMNLLHEHGLEVKV